MDRKKILLYVSVAFAWLLIVVGTLVQEHSNTSFTWGAVEGETKQVSLDGGGAIFYGPLATGDTHVTLEYNRSKVSAVIPEKSEEVVCRSVFPAGEKYVGASFGKDKSLDTVVLFSSSEAYVFEHILAIDSDMDRVAYLEANESDCLSLVISTFNKTTITKVELQELDPIFLESPQIESALFVGADFKLDTACGNYKVSLSSLI